MKRTRKNHSTSARGLIAGGSLTEKFNLNKIGEDPFKDPNNESESDDKNLIDIQKNHRKTQLTR
jgi:hypothetical protein